MNPLTLMFHDIYIQSPEESGFNSTGANVYKMPINQFRDEIRILAKICPETYITVDDGGVSSFTIIAPILKEYGLHGHFYISTDYIGKSGFMSEEEVRELDRNGHIIGSHSCSHPMNINTLSKDARKREWTDSVAKVNKILGKKIEEVSIPNGYYNSNDLQLLANLGIKTVFTSNLADNFEIYGLKVIGRLGLANNISIEQFRSHLTNEHAIAMIIRKQKTLNIIKTAMGPMYNHTKKLIRKFIH